MRVEAAMTRLLLEPAGASRLHRIGLIRESWPWWGRCFSGPERGWGVALRYFSLDAGFTGDPMLDHLAERIGVSLDSAIAIVVRLHETAARWSDEAGNLALFRPEAIAKAICWPASADDVFTVLISCGFLSKHRAIPGWEGRYHRLIADRKRKALQQEEPTRHSAERPRNVRGNSGARAE